jgi:hypothetical protein
MSLSAELTGAIGPGERGDDEGQRSLPQMQAWVTATIASVGSTRRASGTLSTRTSPAPYMTVARMDKPPHLVDAAGGGRAAAEVFLSGR